jgi:hypothetical protein
LKVEVDGRAVEPQFVSTSATEGPGPTLRVVSEFRIEAVPGTLRYEDRNYADRSGWKEIVTCRGCCARAS